MQCSLHTQELAGAESGDGFPGKGRGAENRTQGRAVRGREKEGRAGADTEGFPLGRPVAPAPRTLRDLCVLRAELNPGLCVPSCFYVRIKKVTAFVFGSGLGFFWSSQSFRLALAVMECLAETPG